MHPPASDAVTKPSSPGRGNLPVTSAASAPPHIPAKTASVPSVSGAADPLPPLFVVTAATNAFDLTCHLGGAADERLNISALHEIAFSEPAVGTGANANPAST